MAKFGLLGRDITYSFSRSYFAEKFKKEKLDHTYVNFDIDTIELFNQLLLDNENVKGINVTIPYKEAIIPYLDKLNKQAEKIGAVNTIKFTKKGKLVGYNTDFYGFKNSLKPLLKQEDYKALILGTGGASKAVAYALKKLDIPYKFVSRQAKDKGQISYQDVSTSVITEHQILINCTPVGTFPNVDSCPDIPYQAITSTHILYDLIYNPSETKFLKLGRKNGAQTQNGLKMLELQAEKSWEIWNS